MSGETLYSVRAARADDLAGLVNLLADDVLGRTRERVSDPLPSGYAIALAEILASPATQILVVETEGRMIGSLQLTVIPNLSDVGARRAIFEAVHVAPADQGRGAGAFLAAEAIAAARRAGCGQIVLTSSNVRRDAHRFWARLGFEATHVGMKLRLT